MTVMTEAVLYIRVSSDKQSDGVSLDVQLRECRAYAARQPGWVLGSEYQDVMSGKRDDRPQYQRMLADIRALTAQGRRVALVVWRLDRLGRRLLERVARREELVKLGCETHSAMEGGLVSDLAANLLAAVAQEEVRVLGERVKGARRAIRERGWRPVGSIPYGYVVRDATPAERADGSPRRVLDLDPEAADVVREVFRRVCEGESIQSVGRWARTLPSGLMRGRSFHVPSIRFMLDAPVYAARHERHDGGDVLDQPPGKWPSIISDETYRRMRDEIRRSRRLPKQASQRYLLSGFARCSRCAGRMVGNHNYGKQHRYRCDASGCTVTLAGGALDAALLAQVTPMLTQVAMSDGPLRRSLAREWDRLRDAGADRLDSRRVTALRATLGQGKKRLADAAVLLVDGALDRAGYDAARERIEADVRAAQGELERLETAGMAQAVLPPLGEVLARLGGWSEALTAGDIAGTRRVLAEIVDHLTPVKLGYGKYDAAITWTPLGDALRQAAGALQAAA